MKIKLNKKFYSKDAIKTVIAFYKKDYSITLEESSTYFSIEFENLEHKHEIYEFANAVLEAS